MPTNQGVLFKEAIEDHLDNLVNNGIIQKYYEDDLTLDVLNTARNGDPIAILGLNSDLTIERNTTTNNLNTYTFWVMFISKIANKKQPSDIEDFRDNVMSEFAQDTTYGLQNGWVDPPSSPAPPAQDQDKSIIMFLVKLTAHIASDLSTIS